MMIDPIGIGMSGTLAGMNAYIGNMRQGSGMQRADTAQRANGMQKLGGADDSGKKGSSSAIAVDEDSDKKRRFDSFECQTCKNRKYQDGSDDSGVSFQTPTKIAPEAAAAAVRGHEQEHVVRNQAKAKRDGDEVVSQSVTLHTGICEECGKVYISGGTTRTTLKRTVGEADKFNVGKQNQQKGEALDIAV